MIRPLSLAQHTLLADLLEHGEADLFDPEFPENGSIVVRPGQINASAGHVYYHGYRPAGGEAGRTQRYARYLGRSDDPTVASRTARFGRIKAVRAERTTTVRALIGAGVPRPARITGQIIEAIAKVGLFTSGAVLLGTAAYQTYGGVLGVRLPKIVHAAANDHVMIALAMCDRARGGGVLDVVRNVDPSFTLVGDQALVPSQKTLRSTSGVQIVVMVGHSGDGPSSLAGYLIEKPARSLVLHGPGIPVAVAAPERYIAYSMLVQSGYQTAGVAFTRDRIAELVEALRVVGREAALARCLAEAEGIVGSSNC
jgi:hypothetical protein